LGKALVSASAFLFRATNCQSGLLFAAKNDLSSRPSTMIANAIIVRVEGPAVSLSRNPMAKLSVATILLFCTSLVFSQNQSTDETKLIALVKSTPVSRIDSALPAVRFDQWLRTEAGADGRYQWEVNDCGEQTGAPGQNSSEIPTCVEADAWLKDGREMLIMIAVTSSADALGRRQSFTVYFAQLITTREKITIRQLSDFPAALVRTHDPASTSEIAK